MSTYFYFECLSHTPPLQSSDEISQHDDIHVQNAIRLAQGLAIDPQDVGDYFETRMPWFLREHEHCAIGIVNEYGEHRPIPGRGLERDRAAFERRVIRLDAERSELRDRLEQVQADLEDAQQLLDLEAGAS
jgi:hypothetical protein